MLVEPLRRGTAARHGVAREEQDEAIRGVRMPEENGNRPCEQGIAERERRLLANFRLLDDRFLQFEYLMSFVADLDELPDGECDESFAVDGCNGKAWIELSAPSGCLSMRGSADALVIKSLIGVLSWLLNGRTLREIREWKPAMMDDPLFRKQVVGNRRKGFESMIDTVRRYCGAACTSAKGKGHRKQADGLG